MKRKLLGLMTALIMAISLSSSVFAASVETQRDTISIEGISTTKEQLADGITVLLVKDNNGEFTTKVYNGNLQLQQLQELQISSDTPIITSIALDGVLDWAIFHLGFKDWNADNGDLYFTIQADEPLSYVTGNVYVRSTSWLFPKTYYSNFFTCNLMGSSNTSRLLSQNIDTGDDSSVRLGFSNVIVTTISGDSGSFANNSMVVNK